MSLTVLPGFTTAPPAGFWVRTVCGGLCVVVVTGRLVVVVVVVVEAVVTDVVVVDVVVASRPSE